MGKEADFQTETFERLRGRSLHGNGNSSIGQEPTSDLGWAESIDLHVPFYRTFWKCLYFLFEGRTCDFRVLPFGLVTDVYINILSAQTKMSVLDLPSRKLFIKDVAAARPYAGNQGPLNKIPVWQLGVPVDTRTFSCVWIQGTVVQELAEGDVLCVDDGTAVAEVTGCTKIPPSCPKVKPGQYVMIIGLLVSAEQPTVRAIKIQDLSTSISAETTWLLEVVDQCLRCI